MQEDPIRQALDGDDAALREIYREPGLRARLWGDGGLTSMSLLALLVPAALLAAWGQARALGMFGVTPPQDLVGVLWGWVGCKLPLIALVWLAAVHGRA